MIWIYQMGWSPFAHLNEVDVSIKPPSWTGQKDKLPDEIPLVNGAKLKGANLQNAYMVGAFLIKADLRDAQLQEADLEEASLQEADLEGA